MGFLDKAKQAATELTAKADGLLANAGLAPAGVGGPAKSEADRLLRDLGIHTYNAAAGKPVLEGAREHLLAELQRLDAAGQLANVVTSDQAPAAPAPPPPPGAVAAAINTPVPPPPAAAAPPMAPPAAPAATVANTAVDTPAPTSVTPPPPPSWASKSE